MRGMSQKDKYSKQIDLHESEWKKAGKREPILGSGSSVFLRITVPLMIFGYLFVSLARWWMGVLRSFWAFPTIFIVFMITLCIFALVIMKPVALIISCLPDLILRLLRRG